MQNCCNMHDRAGEQASSRGIILNRAEQIPIPCAGCKILRIKCVPESCPFAPYFPPSQQRQFAWAHKIFGASNISKMLSEVPQSQRQDVAKSLIYEAKARIHDPVYGCQRAIFALQQEAITLQFELYALRTQLMQHQFQENVNAATALAYNYTNRTTIDCLVTPLAFNVSSPTTSHNELSLFSLWSSQTKMNCGSTEQYEIGSSTNIMASLDLMKDTYWSELLDELMLSNC